MKTKIEKNFGKYVCNDDTLKKYMNPHFYSKYKKLKNKGLPLDPKTAQAIAKAIKEWAIHNEATHYSHWFMPLTNKTAAKQVSFIEFNANGKLIEDFNEKSLIMGEADASSFPCGGERVTFEARGYTVWDYTSPVFIKEDFSKNKVVYIPTAFCSFNGTALDEKTPLLRAIESLNIECLKILRILGDKKTKKVNFCVGAEQEYFLIKKEYFEKRLDLKTTEKTLFGSKPLMSQEQYSHYYGLVKNDVSSFMNEVDEILLKMGITAKQQHNEVAPCQYEFVPIYNNVNISSDQNQIIMEVISSTAEKHGFKALFAEKPFSYLNGSGKHENWSLSTDNGTNLFNSKLKDKNIFYTFFVSMICAIDKYYPLIRLSTAYRNNDLRLGGTEAPPALISVYTGDLMLSYLNSFNTSSDSTKISSILETGVKSLPKTEKDFCDRNRTSPFAFSQNKFEFRMPGSSQNVSWPSTCMCVALTETLKEFNDKVKNEKNKKEALLNLLKTNFKKHKKIIFNENNYDEYWLNESQKRKLKIYPDSFSVIDVFDDKNIIKAFKRTNVLTYQELKIRKNNFIKDLSSKILIEAKVMNEILDKNILPSLNNFLIFLSHNKNLWTETTNNKIESALNRLSKLNGEIKNLIDQNNSIEEINLNEIKEKLLPCLEKTRKQFDSIENLIPINYKPFPSYNDILF